MYRAMGGLDRNPSCQSVNGQKAGNTLDRSQSITGITETYSDKSL